MNVSSSSRAVRVGLGPGPVSSTETETASQNPRPTPNVRSPSPTRLPFPPTTGVESKVRATASQGPSSDSDPLPPVFAPCPVCCGCTCKSCCVRVLRRPSVTSTLSSLCCRLVLNSSLVSIPDPTVGLGLSSIISFCGPRPPHPTHQLLFVFFFYRQVIAVQFTAVQLSSNRVVQRGSSTFRSLQVQFRFSSGSEKSGSETGSGSYSAVRDRKQCGSRLGLGLGRR